MLSSNNFIKVLKLIVLIISIQSCAYYNTFYNAEEYFAEAQKLTRENQTESVSRDEINLYSKAIEKSKKLLQKFPDSKYRDDAQFIIAKAYYFKGDYLLAKRYFEDLSSLYSNSPYISEVPIWIGKCLLETGDLEMARYEASRVLRGGANRGLQADALLLMGEIAVQQDSLSVAENYLEQVIDRSPDGFTKAQAQFQVGRMRENESDYEGALKAYQTVSKYKPSESLKVEAIIRQTSMLKALNRDEDAVEMIQDMLLSDKFVEIRGQLEVELGKLFLVMDEIDLAESKFTTIVEDYNRTEVAAEASFYLGELYLTKRLDYIQAKTAFANVKTQSPRSPLMISATQRTKQVERYEKLQLDHTNLQRQLQGLPPVVKTSKKDNSSTARKNRSNSRGRARGGKQVTAEESAASRKFEGKSAVVIETVEVTAADSVQFFKLIDENRYSLAEYMLFELTRVDTTLEILKNLENSTSDSSMRHQCAYMQYYAIETIEGDKVGGQAALDHIEKNYPQYFNTIMNKEGAAQLPDPNEDRIRQIAVLFESQDYLEASNQYYSVREDSTISSKIRGKACFNHGWLNDYFLFDKASAVESYSLMISHYPDNPLTKTARNRLNALTREAIQNNETQPEDQLDNVMEEDMQDSGRKSKRPQNTAKTGEKD
ncbi:MAG: tetratricopeptide repeat protein [Candidatus Marinimicrobia bacterium]|nr:tetratricopeptide repeat protein [Candidatus Neomarinimicrobiota bacterium]